MMNHIKHGFYWLLDYLYVLRTEFSVYFRRDSAETYRRPGGRPVIILPGVYENWRFVRPLAKVLAEHGYDVHVLDELGYNVGTNEAMAALVRDYCVVNNLKHVTLLAHSKGGLIGKHLLIQDPDATIFTQLIAINTPFAGSLYAYFLPFKSLRMFTPNSPALKLLAQDIQANARIISVYGLFDPHIPGVNTLTGAHNIQLSTYGHFRPISDERVHATILDLLKN